MGLHLPSAGTTGPAGLLASRCQPPSSFRFWSQFPLCQPQRRPLHFTCKVIPTSFRDPSCADLADLPSISSHGGVKWGAPCPVRLVGVSSSLQEAAGSSWPRESGSQVQGRLSSAHSVSLRPGPSVQQWFPGFRTSQPGSLCSGGSHSPTEDRWHQGCHPICGRITAILAKLCLLGVR